MGPGHIFFIPMKTFAGEYTAAGTAFKTYGYKPGSTWTTDPLFMKTGGEYYYYHNDHLGTPQKMTDSYGAVVWSAKYSSFGKADVDQASTVVNNLRFSGQYCDAEIGLHYNWFRNYDPDNGRYFTSDPIGLAGGINLYSYVLNDPINLIDPFGLRDEWNPTDFPCPLVTPFQAYGFMNRMRSLFGNEYTKSLQLCLMDYNKDMASCGDDAAAECGEEGYRLCIDRAKKDLQSCKQKASYWDLLAKNYSLLKALFDMYRFTEDEALEHYSNIYLNL